MIQRIQSLYLLINLLLLVVLATGVTLVSYADPNIVYSVSALTIERMDLTHAENITKQWHFGGLILFVLILSNIVTLLSYKNLKRQFKLGRQYFFTYTLLLMGFLVWIYFGYGMLGDDLEGSRKMGAGFLIFVCGLPFIFLANLGIKRDKAIIDSIDRIR